MCDKRALRAHFRAVRAAARSEDKDEAVFRALRASAYWAAERFFVYHAVGSETGTARIIRALLKAGKSVCLPRIEGGVMTAAPYGALACGAFGIPAPLQGEDTPCDVALVPLLAVDGTGVRLGCGGGYYDRYFAAHPSVVRVGLCYEAQRADELPREAHDILLQAVVTECGVTLF